MATLKDIRIYREAQELFVLTVNCIRNPVKSDCFPLYNQTLRSAQSIQANIAEGYGKRDSQREFARFIQIAIGSIKETISNIDDVLNLYPELNWEQLHVIRRRYRQLEYTAFHFLKALRCNK